MIAAISFIEAPLKFRAPGITLPIGLSIGRLVFRALNRIEWVMGLFWVAAAFRCKARFTDLSMPLVVIIILALQTFWLLPQLGRRADLICEGVQPGESSLHLYYIAGETAKLLMLACGGCIFLYRLIKI
jgi:hypothetical protein